MADPNESHRDRRSPEDDALSPENARTPEVVDAEVVEEAGQPSAPPKPADPVSPQDEEAFRQYQQFLEFQKFQEWQRQQGSATGPGESAWTPAKRPWWQRILRLLRFKFVRRLLYVVLALVLLLTLGRFLVPMMVYYMFSPGGSSESGTNHVGTPGNQDPGVSPAAPTLPQDTIIGMHNFLAYGPAGDACELFTESGKAAFAQHHNAPDCPTAAQQLHTRVTEPVAYSFPKGVERTISISGDDARVPLCQLAVEGGPRLGTFGLHRMPNGGWLIDSYQPEPPNCTG